MTGRSLVTDSIVIILLLIIPYLLYAYRYVPASEVWDTFLGPIHSQGFKTVKHFVHAFMTKLVPFLFVAIIFVRSDKWYYHVYLSYLFLLLYQMGGIINDNYQYVDEFEIIHTIPFAIIVAVILYIMRSFRKNDIEKLKLYYELDERIQQLKSKQETTDQKNATT